LAELFIVSKVMLGEGTGEDIGILVKKAGGAKCERCWNWSDSVGKSADFPAFCARCSAVVAESKR
jgi:isoleucyl-tRNA synthetase